MCIFNPDILVDQGERLRRSVHPNAPPRLTMKTTFSTCVKRSLWKSDFLRPGSCTCILFRMHLFSSPLRWSGSPLYDESPLWIGRRNKNWPNPSMHVWSKKIQVFDQSGEQHKTMIHMYETTLISPISFSTGNAQDLPSNFHTIMPANNTIQWVPATGAILHGNSTKSSNSCSIISLNQPSGCPDECHPPNLGTAHWKTSYPNVKPGNKQSHSALPSCSFRPNFKRFTLKLWGFRSQGI
jgi:hypothetical protein